MSYQELLLNIKNKYNVSPAKVEARHQDEVYITTSTDDFNTFCFAFHEELPSTIMAMFAQELNEGFRLYCAFLGRQYKKWFWVTLDIPKTEAQFDSLAKRIYSANLFEREIKEMFGIEPLGNPDYRRLHLHEEVWPRGSFPLRKNFVLPPAAQPLGEYSFTKVDGEGLFEVPVGPVHAGIIGPGHFRFSVAGEPIINLEIRLGFTHRGVEKLLEGKTPDQALPITECIAGDAAFSHSLAFCHAIEKINNLVVPFQHQLSRGLCLELERLYNHVADIGSIALDVGFSQPAAFASIIKEKLQQLNQLYFGSRFLRGINTVGGVKLELNPEQTKTLLTALKAIGHDFQTLKSFLESSVSFLDRVDTTGILKNKTAEDFGVLGFAGRASGSPLDLRRDLPGIYQQANFQVPILETGDVLARLKVRCQEFEESLKLIAQFAEKLADPTPLPPSTFQPGFGLGYCEGWRGPTLYWVDQDGEGKIERCKIVDPSFRNWQGLAYAVYDNIIPDFPVCNKSFNQSYPGNDL